MPGVDRTNPAIGHTEMDTDLGTDADGNVYSNSTVPVLEDTDGDGDPDKDKNGYNSDTHKKTKAGGEVINWFKEGEDWFLWSAGDNDEESPKNVITIYAHGGTDYMNSPEGSIYGAKALDKILKPLSSAWSNFRENGGKFTLVIKACWTGFEADDNNLAKVLSHQIKGLTVIAPNGPYQANFLGGENVVKQRKYTDTWNVYYNNKLINKFND